VLVNTGVESTCSCFGYDLDDLLIPVEPINLGTLSLKLKPILKP
jgi:hypothetical protein